MVFDTMVLVYAVLGVPSFREDSLKAIRKAKEIYVPDFIRAEWANVLWKMMMEKKEPKLDMSVALAALEDMEAIISGFVQIPLLWHSALEMSVASNHPAYDTLFISLAKLKKTKVVTYDQLMLKKFPDWTLSVPMFLNMA